jgi:hypothetical protein
VAALTISNEIISAFRNNATCSALFANPLTGTITTLNTTVTGTGTLFTTELEVGQVIGTIVNGFRRIVSITDDIELEVEDDFDVDFTDEAFIRTNIDAGMDNNIDVGVLGSFMGITFVSSDVMPMETTNARTFVKYCFVLSIGFMEPDSRLLEIRKSDYDAAINNVIDIDPTFNNTVIGTTEPGEFQFMEHPNVHGYCMGMMALETIRREIRGQR